MPSVKLEAEPERVADRHGDVADPDRVRVGELRRAQAGAVDLDHGEVVGREGPDERALELLARSRS